MTARTKSMLKGYFNTGDTPSESNFADMIDTIGSITLIVAANDASDASKGRADYVCDGTDDDVQINAAITALASPTGGTVTLSEGTYNLQSTITIASDVKLKLLGGAALVPQGDFNVVTMTKESSIEGGNIDTSGVSNYSKAAIYLDGSEQFHVTDNVCNIENISLSGGDSGFGIHMFADGVHEWIAGVKVTNLLINDFEDGIRLDAQTPASAFNFINGNHFFDIWINRCDYALRLLSENISDAVVNGNLFFGISIEPDSSSVNALYCEGVNNIFNGIFVWDWSSVEDTSPYAIELTSGSSRNYIMGYVLGKHIKDYGQHTTSFAWHNTVVTTVTPSQQLHPISSPPTSQWIPTGYGPHTDYLVNADTRFTVAVITGDAPTTGTLAQMFNDDPTTGPYWASGKTFPMVIEIDFGGDIGRINAVGLFTDAATRPGGTKFEFYDTSESSWLSIYDDGVTDASNDQSEYWITTWDHELGAAARVGISKIRITIDDIAAGKDGVRLNCWWLFMGDSFGERWLARGGGEVYGEIDYAGTMTNSTKDPTNDAPDDWVEVKIGGSTYFLPAYTAS